MELFFVKLRFAGLSVTSAGLSVQEAVTEKNLNTILNKRVLARQIPVQSKGNQKNFCKR